MRKTILLSAFACNPAQGSEPGYGWNWSLGLANLGFEVHCLTRNEGKSEILKNQVPANLTFHYISLPFGLEKLFELSQPTMYLYYLLWQYKAYRIGKRLHKLHSFQLVHHVTWGSVQLGSFLYKLGIPFIFGPAGGGQQAPVAFKEYFGSSWASEMKREKVSRLLLNYSPACKSMLQNATAVWVSNPDTFNMATANGAKRVFNTMDAALPASFFPVNFQPKTPVPGQLKLLWVGRFLPRKGILLLLEVMEKLKSYPSISLTVVGDGEQKDLFLEKLSVLGLEETVFWKGKVTFEEVKQFYHTHDVFLFASLRDSCPAQLVEAMAYGLPVITINLHGQAYIVTETTGFRCACETPAIAISEIVTAILKLYHDPSLVTAMSSAGYDFARQQTWEQKIETIVDQSYPDK